MNNQQCRKDLEQFCCDFLNERNRQLYNVIDNYRHLFEQIDIQQLNLTQETFDSSFKSICRKLFNIRLADRNYIIPLLEFALKLHRYYQTNYYPWYHIEILIDSLTDVLTGIGFQSKELSEEPTNCQML